MKAIKYILFLSLLTVLGETRSQSSVAIESDSLSITTFSDFMDNVMQKVQQYTIPTDVLYSSEKNFNGKTQETTTAKLDTEFEIKQAKLHKRSGSNVKFSVKDAVTNSKTDQKGKKAFSEKDNVKALLDNNPCINRKGVFDAFGKNMLFAGVKMDTENGTSYAHYMWTGSGKHAGDTIRVTTEHNSGAIRHCELISSEKKDNLEVVFSFSYSFTNKDDSFIPIEMCFKSIEKNVSNTNPFEYTISNIIVAKN